VGLVAVIARLPMLESLLLNRSVLAAACMSTPASHGILEVAEDQARPRSNATRQAQKHVCHLPWPPSKTPVLANLGSDCADRPCPTRHGRTLVTEIPTIQAGAHQLKIRRTRRGALIGTVPQRRTVSSSLRSLVRHVKSMVTSFQTATG
jgi:hypothetical protein